MRAIMQIIGAMLFFLVIIVGVVTSAMKGKWADVLHVLLFNPLTLIVLLIAACILLDNVETKMRQGWKNWKDGE